MTPGAVFRLMQPTIQKCSRGLAPFHHEEYSTVTVHEPVHINEATQQQTEEGRMCACADLHTSSCPGRTA
jgi:hypothetical protein